MELIPLPKELAYIGEKGCWSDTTKITTNADLFFTGLGSSVKVNSARAMHEQGIKVIGFLDSFETLKTHAFASKALPFLNKLLVPTAPQATLPNAIAVGNASSITSTLLPLKLPSLCCFTQEDMAPRTRKALPFSSKPSRRGTLQNTML